MFILGDWNRYGNQHVKKGVSFSKTETEFAEDILNITVLDTSMDQLRGSNHLNKSSTPAGPSKNGQQYIKKKMSEK